MPSYLTPSQFRARGYGVKLDDYIDSDLAATLRRAASAVNTYTAAPTLPVPHDFRGGSIVSESHTWRVDPYARRPQRRVFLYHRPVLTVSSARIYVTNTQYVEFDSTEIYYEPAEGWIEPASANLTSYGLFGAAMLPYVGLEHPHFVATYTYGRTIPVAERLYYSDEANTWRASSGFWTAASVVIQVNGVVVPSTDYQVDRVEGTIKFTANVPEDGDTVDASYTTSLHPDIAEAQGLIAASLISEKALVARGMAGLRAIKVAEISLERDFRREAKGTPVVIPPEASALLDPFIFRSVAFG